MPQDLQRARELFLHAVGKLPPEQWDAYLAQACGCDEELRRQAAHLLQVHREAGSFLDQPAGGRAGALAGGPEGGTAAFQPQTEDTVIGPYKLIEQIGEGGMGTVWMAQQTRPVKRLVAVKLIKAGMDSKQIIARFEAERQALALMDHPNIARVLDAGTTSAGRPYFVMDLVKGVPITRYCDEHHLTPRQRLELFIPVCQAVQHAHQKGIIHRDLKPSNVLVAPYDGKAVVKVIDFGVAKAAGQPLTERTLVTGFGAIVGTLEYMSPEQAELNNHDIDTRSDIYALGVLLYELLAGSPPFSRKELAKAGMVEMLRVIREQEPSKPSKKLSTAEGLPTLAANRGTEPAKLTRLIRGELDWIVMKALEKDRNRRYETANGFAIDVQRYLADEPVQACPPSPFYRWRKFARRNKAAVTATAGVSTALGVAVVVLAVSLVTIRQEQEATAKANNEREQEQLGRIAALEGETKALGREKTALDGWRQTSYFMGTALAFREYQDANVDRAAAILDECPEDLRRWEWHYLKRLCASDLATNYVHPSFSGHVFSPNGKQLALVDWATLQLHACDLAAGKNGADFGDHEYLVSGDPAFRTLFRVNVKPRNGHEYLVSGDPAFSADGRRLVVSGVHRGKRLVKVLVAATGKEVGVREISAKETDASDVDVARSEAPGVALSPDGKVAAAIDVQGKLLVWEVASGKPRFDVVAHPNRLGRTRVSFNHDGSRLATDCESDPTVKVWDLAAGKQVLSFDPGNGFSFLVYSPRGTWLAAAGPYVGPPNSNVQLWDATTGKTRQVLRGHTDRVSCLAFSPDERYLATGSFDRKLTLWDVTTGSPVATYCGHNKFLQAVAFTGDGKQVVSLDANGVIKTWDATHAPDFTVLKGGLVTQPTFSPDGRQVAAGLIQNSTSEYQVRVWEAASGAEVAKFATESVAPDVAFSPDGRSIAAAENSGLSGRVRVWDLRRGKLDRSFPAAGEGLIELCQAVAYSPDGKLLAAGGVDRLVHVWDAATGAKKYRLVGHQRALGKLAFSRDSRRLVSVTVKDANKPCEIKVWDTATGAEVYSRESPEHILLNPDGEAFALLETERTARVYKVATGGELVVLKGHVVQRLVLSPDGLRIVTWGKDQKLRLWDAKTGRNFLTLGHHPSPYGMNGLAFSPDGWKLVSASGEDVRVWDATPLKK
jgi:WD40 repeat protein/serine/threonine protein kinase